MKECGYCGSKDLEPYNSVVDAKYTVRWCRGCGCINHPNGTVEETAYQKVISMILGE